MRSVVFFNNKGGVGKTTLACNVASYIALHKSRRVLLVDADPQCNATQVILGDELIERIYAGHAPGRDTLYHYLKPIEEGEPSIDINISPVLGTSTRFQTDLIPGHPRMSIVEDRLSDAWSGLRGGDIGGFRITNWCTHLLKSLQSRYDLAIFDVGPSLGALNRTVILASDFVVTPFGCDIFSLLGIRNISEWIRAWDRLYNRSVVATKDDKPTLFAQYGLVDTTKDRFRFAGYSVQQYVTRTFAEGPRAVKSYDRIMSQIPSTVSRSMKFISPPNLTRRELELGHIPYLYSLVPMAQTAKSPIHALTSRDGVVGSQYAQVKSYEALMEKVCNQLLSNVGMA